MTEHTIYFTVGKGTVTATLFTDNELVGVGVTTNAAGFWRSLQDLINTILLEPDDDVQYVASPCADALVWKSHEVLEDEALCDDEEAYYNMDPLEREEAGYLADGTMFADPGGNSALRAATPDNPRNLPCPTCYRPNRLTPADVARGYQCNGCAEHDEMGF